MMATRTGEHDDLFSRFTVRSYVEENPRFLHREWLAAEVEERLEAPDCRFLLLTAEPGAGKSTFLAQLAYDHPDWPVYFIRRDQRTPLADVDARSFLLRIGYQLAAVHPELFTPEQVKIEIEQRVKTVGEGGEAVGAEVQRILASPFFESVFHIQQHIGRNRGRVAGLRVEELIIEPRRLDLSDLGHMALLAPAQGLLGRNREERIVILVDALDEIRYHSGVGSTVLDWLGGAPQLPENVRFVLASRPPDRALRTFMSKQAPHLQHLKIETEDKRVQKDLRIYVGALVEQEAVVSILEEREGGAVGFTKEAIEKADGNLGYLDALARSIDQSIAQANLDSLKNLLNLQQLPEKLEGLYAFFLHQIRTALDQESVEVEDPISGEIHYLKAWPAVYRRLLGVLVVALEPLTRSQIEAFGEIKAEEYVAGAMDRLGQFLDIVDGRYRLYHATLPEFLTAEATQDRHDMADLYFNAEQWHRQIANYFWERYRGDWQNCDDYGLNNLATHLSESSDMQRLQALISKEWMQARYKAGGYSYSGFLDDLNLVWQATLAQDARDPAALARLQAVRQVVSHEPTDLQIMTWLGRGDEALGEVGRLTEPDWDFRSLLEIYTAMEQQDRPDPGLLDRAWKAARSIQNEQGRAEALCDLAVVLAEAGDGRASMVFSEARSIAESIGGSTLRNLAAALTRVGRFDEAEQVSHSGQASLDDRASALSELAVALTRLGDERAKALFKEALEAADSIELDYRREIALREVAVDLVRADYFDTAERVARTLPDGWSRAKALSEVAKALAKAGDSRALSLFGEAVAADPSDESLGRVAATMAQVGFYVEALELARSIPDEYEQEKSLLEVTLGLIQAGRYDEAKEMARSMLEDISQAEALLELAVALARAGDDRANSVFDETARAARSLPNDYFRADILCKLTVALARTGESRASSYFKEAEEAARAVQDDNGQEGILLVLAGGMVEIGRYDEAASVARSIRDHEAREQALRKLVLALARDGDIRASSMFGEWVKEARFARSREDDAVMPWPKLAAALAQGGYLDIAEKVARFIPHNQERALALREVGEALARAGDNRAGAVLNEGVQVAESIEHDKFRDETLRELTSALALGGHFDEATAAVRSIRYRGYRVEALSSLAKALAIAGHSRADAVFTQATRTAKFMRDREFRGEVLSKIAAAMAQVGRFDEAQRVARSIRYERSRAEALCELATALAEAGDRRASSVFADAAKAARAVPYDLFRPEAFRKLSGALASAGRFEEAAEVTETINDDRYRATAVRELAVALAKAGDHRASAMFEDAAQAARSIEHEYSRARSLCELAVALANVGDGRANSAIIAAAEAANAVQGAVDRENARREIATILADLGRVDEALLTLGPRRLYDFIVTLADWSPSFEKLAPGSSVIALREATGVLSWLRQEWREIHELLSAAESGESRKAHYHRSETDLP